ncbi:hypothetical protein JOD54_001697 [Actinokineospora baliensis]|nr:hypothetical protein [Actinokineospora baliensis]
MSDRCWTGRWSCPCTRCSASPGSRSSASCT